LTLDEIFKLIKYDRREKCPPKIRHEVETEDLSEASIVRPCNDGCKPENDTDVGKDDLAVLVRCKHNRAG
jgi:hypothetical protein